ncbi:UDP-N-acetylglucosamine 4,6-dehydratase (inverting) [Alphaproteobacteria bacterium]|nr:UDP-N-acetylglucosamine 4,6-dehydratase (inverting) [Alphaproteobacteria bacterium]
MFIKGAALTYQAGGKSILITGGTGSFGQKFVEFALNKLSPKKLVIFSRDELKQFDMASRFPEEENPYIRYFIGDVRDRNRLIRAFSGIDIVIHAAAMKQIVAAEYNPTECIATNVLGAQNVIDAAIENGVEKVVALSTDKAANPINLYGATKLCSDKLFIAANNLSGGQKTRFSVVRYGNVAGSRGSVIPFFKELIASGKMSLPLTHPDMTRFIITLDQGVNLVKTALNEMFGGEIFVPKLPSLKIIDLVPLLGEGLDVHTTGIRPGEKLHEVMIPAEEIRNTVDMGMHYIIQPNHHWWNVSDFKRAIEMRGKPVDGIQEYASDTNPDWLTQEQIADLIAKLAV